MKKIIITFLLPLCAVVAVAQTKKTATTTKKTVTTKAKTPVKPLPVFKSTLDSASYSLGLTMAGRMKSDGLTTLNYPLLMRGLQDALESKTPLLNEERGQQAINNLFGGIAKQKFAPNIAEGKTFLENNKKQAGVKVTASGIQYVVLAEGTGIKPVATDTVLVHYKGTLLNGKQFDSSYDRGEPLSLPLNRVITGWTEGMQLMSTGSKYKFFIPYNLAYGERGAGADIPPYSTLIFEIELLKVNGK
ncbi:FKBP-type peptidyl-prolyl cis-trans isomerase [Pedobacter metabolipauper]|uniref:Peptidyl-prolyl cis-trans isomerase n=1 Tax=Pedobacter metabolipauper TaxID=425513 RepID=A0A4R6STB5_9SPHI|nr:FKBP-type peptidyl-prolyl cis-trans isomerase [Pedobacter metabolipauper]TDQ07655.1 FKBP-type peptidyl-prolyl cis-trans isomerase FklB [Pedobacter metabolipauper]